MAEKIGAIVLAGGQSRRFGGDKRRARLPNGEELLLATVRRYAEAFVDLRIGLRGDDTALGADLQPLLSAPRQQVIFSTRAAGGMGFTLADTIATCADWDVSFVALGDMPFVTHTTLCQLRDAARALGDSAWLLQPQCFGLPGHPVAFHSALFPALAALAGDEGARGVVRAHRNRLRYLTVLDAGVLQDVDTPAALTQSRNGPTDGTAPVTP